MSINWDMAGRGNNALAYFQLGQQLGQQVIDGRVNRALGRVLTGGMGQPAPNPMGIPAGLPGSTPTAPSVGAPTVPAMGPGMSTPGIGDQHNRDLGRSTADMETIARYNPDLFMKLQQRQAEQAEVARKREMENRQTFRQLLQMAGTNPQQAFAAARQLGIPLNNVPQPGTPEFEPWRQTQLFILKAAETPEGKDMLTNAAKEYMLTLPPDQRDPNNPAFYQGFGKYLEAQQVKTIPFTQGGGVAGYSPMTGQTTTIVAPNPGGFAAGTPVGTPPPAASPPPAAIDYLRKNPTLKAEFDAKYGPGAADRVLGGQPAGNPPFGG